MGRLESTVLLGHQRPLGPDEEQRPQGRAEWEVNTRIYIIKCSLSTEWRACVEAGSLGGGGQGKRPDAAGWWLGPGGGTEGQKWAGR